MSGPVLWLLIAAPLESLWGAVLTLLTLRWALRIHTLYRGMRADAELGRPPAPPEVPAIAAALDRERHHHARPRPRRRIPRPRLRRRRDPFPELAHDDDTGAWPADGFIPAPPVLTLVPSAICPFCTAARCRRCRGCSCPGIAGCDCTLTVLRTTGGDR